MLRRIVVLTLVTTLALASPAAAFVGGGGDVRLEYPTDAPPAVTAIGAIALRGPLSGTILAAGLRDVTFAPIGALTIAERSATGDFANTTILDASLTIVAGSLAADLPPGASFTVDVAAPYGIAAGIPKEEQTGKEGGLLVAAPDLAGHAEYTGGAADLLVFNATVTVRAGGSIVPGWEARAVNRGLSASDRGQENGPAPAATLFSTSGPLHGTWRSDVLAGAPESGLTLRVTPSTSPDFAAAADRLRDAVGEGNGDGVGDLGPLRDVGPLLNGVVLVVNTAGDGPPRAPRVAEARGRAIDATDFAFLRATDVTVSWTATGIAVAGDAELVVSSSGIGAATVLSVLVPALVGLLWLAAIVSIVVYLVRKPQSEKLSGWTRVGIAFGHLVVLVAVLYLWDLGFAATFGTSAVKLLAAGDPGLAVAILAAIELALWVAVFLAFGLPARILIGVALRYFTHRKGFAGAAKSGGLVTALVVGQLVGLWLLNAPLRLGLGFLPD